MGGEEEVAEKAGEGEGEVMRYRDGSVIVIDTVFDYKVQIYPRHETADSVGAQDKMKT